MRRETNLKRLGEPVGVSCEKGFSTTAALLLDVLVNRGVYASNPWEAAKTLVRKVRPRLITERMVPSQDQIVDLADKIASLPGGERYRVPVLTMGLAAFRVAELVAIVDSDWNLSTDEPFVRLWRSFPTVSSHDSANGDRRPESPLKHRQLGETRDVPLYGPLRDLILEHHDRHCQKSAFFFSDPDGRLVDLSKLAQALLEPGS